MREATIQKIDPAHSDDRGDIIDLLKEDIQHVGLITFSEDAVRANHYHEKTTQWSYTLSGKIEFLWKDIDEEGEPHSVVLEEGDFVTIPPKVIHAYRALEPSSIIGMMTLSRKGTGYEDDTIRTESIIS